MCVCAFKCACMCDRHYLYTDPKKTADRDQTDHLWLMLQCMQICSNTACLAGFCCCSKSSAVEDVMSESVGGRHVDQIGLKPSERTKMTCGVAVSPPHKSFLYIHGSQTCSKLLYLQVSGRSQTVLMHFTQVSGFVCGGLSS